jgi:hypothetical protein
MSLQEIVKQALQDGYLTSALKAEVMRLCAPDTVLSDSEEIYLEQLLGALLTGEVVG